MLIKKSGAFFRNFLCFSKLLLLNFTITATGMSNNSNMISNYSNRISYNSNMISNNSNKRYRITATKDEKLGPEMLQIFYKINFRKMNNAILHSFMGTNFCQIFPDQWNVPLSRWRHRCRHFLT